MIVNIVLMVLIINYGLNCSGRNNHYI